MCMSLRLLCGFALAVSAIISRVAHCAPTASLYLDTYQDFDADPTNDVWELRAAVSSDSDGISGFNIKIVGSHHAELDAPRVMQDTFPPPRDRLAGFTIFAFPDGSFDGDGVLFARQNIEFGNLYYGVGVQAGGTPFPSPPFENINIPWDHPVLLGHGTGDWQAVDFDSVVWPSISVFVDGAAQTDSREVEAIDPSDLTLMVTRHPIPEPASFAILGMAVLGLLGLCRKLC